MWDWGSARATPETHIGQLMNSLLRNGRFNAAIGLHTKGMTVEESEGLFREEGFLEPPTRASRPRAAPTVPDMPTTRWAS